MTLSCFSTFYSPQHPLSASHLPQGRPIPVTHNAQLNSSNSLELMKNPHISPLFKKKNPNHAGPRWLPSPDDHFYVLCESCFLLCPWLPELRPGAGPGPSHRGKILISYAESTVNCSVSLRNKVFQLPVVGFERPLVAFTEHQAHFSWFGVCFAQGSEASLGNGLFPAMGWVRAGISPINGGGNGELSGSVFSIL